MKLSTGPRTHAKHDLQPSSVHMEKNEVVSRFNAKLPRRAIIVLLLIAVGIPILIALGNDESQNPPWVKYIASAFCVLLAMVFALMGRYRYEARFDLRQKTWYVKKYFFRPRRWRSGTFGDLGMVELKRCEYTVADLGPWQVSYQVSVCARDKLKIPLFMSHSIWEARDEATLVSRVMGLQLLDRSGNE